MSAALLTLNTSVPTNDDPGSPVIIVYDNGDWEIAFSGDVDYIVSNNARFVKAISFIDFFVGLMVYFDIGDVDDLDVSGDTVILFLEEAIDSGEDEEPVLLIWDDGEFDVMDRVEAESIFKTDRDAVTNFVAALDLFADFAKWRGSAHVEGAMFNNVEPDEDDDEDKEDE